VLILESGSYDNTKEALKELDAELGRVNASRIIGLVGISHIVEVERVPIPGEPRRVWTYRGKKELRRVPYLAASRNRVMKITADGMRAALPDTARFYGSMMSYIPSRTHLDITRYKQRSLCGSMLSGFREATDLL